MNPAIILIPLIVVIPLAVIAMIIGFRMLRNILNNLQKNNPNTSEGEFSTKTTHAPTESYSSSSSSSTTPEGFGGAPVGPKFVLEGFKGVLKVYEDRVEINKTGSGFITGNSLKTLPIANIVSVSLTPSTVWARGFIEFTVPGGKDSKNIEQAMRNENALPLAAAGQNEMAMQIKSYIEQQILHNVSNRGGATIINQGTSSADELKKYKELLDQGVITEEEFEAKKKQLLGL